MMILISSQWEALDIIESGPSPRRGHSMVTWNDPYGNDIVVVFGGRSQSFANCSYNTSNGIWNDTLCGDHTHAKLIDTTIVLASSDPIYPNCAFNCSGNGWCHFDETVQDSYCICYDEYRGDTCQIKEFQDFEYDVWYLNMTTLDWTKWELCFMFYFFRINDDSKTEIFFEKI